MILEEYPVLKSFTQLNSKLTAALSRWAVRSKGLTNLYQPLVDCLALNSVLKYRFKLSIKVPGIGSVQFVIKNRCGIPSENKSALNRFIWLSFSFQGKSEPNSNSLTFDLQSLPLYLRDLVSQVPHT